MKLFNGTNKKWYNQFLGAYKTLLYISAFVLVLLTDGVDLSISLVLFLLVTKNLFID